MKTIYSIDDSQFGTGMGLGVKEIITYQTGDKVTHDSQIKAQDHIINQLGEFILKKLANSPATNKIKYELTELLVGDLAKAEELQKILNKFLQVY